MKEIIKLIIKIVLCRLMHFAISMSFGIWDIIKDRPLTAKTALIGETLIIVLFQLPMYLIYRSLSAFTNTSVLSSSLKKRYCLPPISRKSYLYVSIGSSPP